MDGLATRGELDYRDAFWLATMGGAQALGLEVGPSRPFWFAALHLFCLFLTIISTIPNICCVHVTYCKYFDALICMVATFSFTSAC